MAVVGHWSVRQMPVFRDAMENFRDQTLNHSILATKKSHQVEFQGTEWDHVIGYGAFGVVWAVTDPRTGKRVALKKLLNVFQSLVSSTRVYRELRMLSTLKHDNVLSAIDIMQPAHIEFFNEIYVVTELMQSDLHKIIVSGQPLTTDHVKVFTYQILRGVKYLHSANILHRDIKPGNLLVNSDCLLKICDFGLARVDTFETRSSRMTQEVVTQYYRPPEILMGARQYSGAIDIWSVGCVMAELLGRRVLFQAQSPLQQLDMILELLGTPSSEDMRGTCEPAKKYVRSKGYLPSKLPLLYRLSQDCDDEAFSLLCQMLAFSSHKRITAAEALNHPYLSEGRTRFHACMCSCCYHRSNGSVVFAADLEPDCTEPFGRHFEDDLVSLHVVREKLFQMCTEAQKKNIDQLYLNASSPLYNKFVTSQCAQLSELPPSPHVWENS